MGSKSSGTTGYTYYAGFQMIVARCIDVIRRIRIDQKVALTANLTGGPFQISAKDLFGGSTGADPQGGVVATMDFQHGYADQEPNSYLKSKIGTSATGGNITASRGVAGVVCQQGNLGNSPYMKSWEFRAERIFVQDDGSPQWYPEKAGIPIPADMAPVQTEGTFFVDGSEYYHDNAGVQYAQVGTSYTGTSTQIAMNCIAARNAYEHAIDPGSTPWTYGGSYWFGTQGSPTHQGEGDLGCWSTDRGPGVGIASVHVLQQCPLDYYDSVPGEIVPGYLGIQDATVVCTPVSNLVYAMNPSHMLREILINNEWGYGYVEDDLDLESFTTAADILFNERFGLGYFWDDSTVALDDLVDMIQQHIDGTLYVDRLTLKWTLGLIRNDYVKGDLPLFTAGVDIISVEDFKRPQFLELVNTILVNFYDMVLGAASTLTLPNSALLLQQGVLISTQTDYGMICNRDLASRVGQRDLKTSGNPLATGTLYLIPGVDSNKLHRGSPFRVTIPDYGMEDVVIRATALSFGNGNSRQIKVTFAEDGFVLPDIAVTPDTPLPPSQNAPLPLVNRLAMELPYFYLARAFGQANVDSELITDPGLGAFGICADRVDNALYARLFVDSGSGYTEDAVLDFCPYGELELHMGKFDTSMSLVNEEDMEDVGEPMFFQIDDEIMSFTSLTIGVFSGLQRGLMDTTPAEHAIGAKVFFFENYLDSDEEQYEDGISIDIKLATVAAAGQLDLSETPVDTILFAGRAARPYAPGNLKVNGIREDAIATQTGSLLVTWAHRDRLLQQDQVVDTSAGDIGPETGTTYTVKVYINGTVNVSTSAISGTSATLTPSLSGTAVVEVSSQRDGLTSWQNNRSTFNYLTSASYIRTENSDFMLTESGSQFILET